ELEREKEELKEYDFLDKRRRALQFTLYDKELTKVTSQLEGVEASRGEQMQTQHALFGRLREIQDQLLIEEDELGTSKQALERLVGRREDKAEELRQAVGQRSELQVELQETQSSVRAKQAALEESHGRLLEVQASIAEREKELASMEPSYATRHRELLGLQQELTQAQSRVEALYGKQGRGKQFSSEEERNSFLQSQIDSLNQQISSKSALLQRVQTETTEQETSLRQEIRRNAAAMQENKAQLDSVEGLTRSIKDLMSKRNDLQESRKAGWREMESFQDELQEAKAELARGKQALSSSLPRHMSVGLATVERIAEDKGLTRPNSKGQRPYMGPLIDNFSLKNDAFRTAVEVAAGNSLFHVIVDTD
ncbi:Smc3, partial [Symbiodinium microadriaticum]